MKTFKQFLIESDLSSYLQHLKSGGYKLLAHQTDENNAQSIIKTVFGAANGVSGTSLWQSPEGVEEVLSSMRAKKIGDDNRGIVHRGSDSIVLMAIPSKISGMPVRSLDQLDGWLFDLNLNGKVPNENIIGYVRFDGTLVKNPNFNPDKSLLK